MLKKCEVKEITLNGNQSEQEQLAIITWYHKKMAEDNEIFLYTPLSLDVEQVRCTLKDVLGLGRQQSYPKSHRVKKFDVPAYVVKLLSDLPLVMSFGIRGVVLAI